MGEDDSFILTISNYLLDMIDDSRHSTSDHSSIIVYILTQGRVSAVPIYFLQNRVNLLCTIIYIHSFDKKKQTNRFQPDLFHIKYLGYSFDHAQKRSSRIQAITMISVKSWYTYKRSHSVNIEDMFTKAMIGLAR